MFQRRLKRARWGPSYLPKMAREGLQSSIYFYRRYASSVQLFDESWTERSSVLLYLVSPFSDIVNLTSSFGNATLILQTEILVRAPSYEPFNPFSHLSKEKAKKEYVLQPRWSGRWQRQTTWRLYKKQSRGDLISVHLIKE